MSENIYKCQEILFDFSVPYFSVPYFLYLCTFFSMSNSVDTRQNIPPFLKKYYKKKLKITLVLTILHDLFDDKHMNSLFKHVYFCFSKVHFDIFPCAIA